MSVYSTRYVIIAYFEGTSHKEVYEARSVPEIRPIVGQLIGYPDVNHVEVYEDAYFAGKSQGRKWRESYRVTEQDPRLATPLPVNTVNYRRASLRLPLVMDEEPEDAPEDEL